MAGFKQREGDFAVTVSRGVYKQVDVYERRGMVFVLGQAMENARLCEFNSSHRNYEFRSP